MTRIRIYARQGAKRHWVGVWLKQSILFGIAYENSWKIFLGYNAVSFLYGYLYNTETRAVLIQVMVTCNRVQVIP